MSFAKTTRPVLRTVAQRQRLFSILDDARRQPVVWISAPPGSGKTTLVSSYVEIRKLPYLWYQVDSGDVDVATFFHFFSEAAKRIRRGITNTLPKLSGQYAADVLAFARHYFRQLFDSVKEPVVVIFDNYHELPVHSALHEVIRIGVSEMPKKVRAIFISRAEPPPAMARFVADGTLLALGWNELRLTPEEVKKVVDIRDLEVSRETLHDLYEKSDGWAAGLVLMLEDARKRGSLAKPPASQPASKVIFDYLAGEVFGKFEDTARQFLMKIACVPQISADAARRLTGEEGAKRILINLALNNYFVTENRIARDSEFQIHPLFRDFLLEEFNQNFSPQARTQLRLKAAGLLEDEGRIDAAAGLFLEADAVDEVSRIIKSNASTLVEQGRTDTLLHWLERLPSEIVRNDPWLLYWLGRCQLPLSPRQSRQHFERSYDGFRNLRDHDAKGLVSSCCGVIDSVLMEFDDLAPLPIWNRALISAVADAGGSLSAVEQDVAALTLFTSLCLSEPAHAAIRQTTDRAYAIVSNAFGRGEGASVSALTTGLLALGTTDARSSRLMDFIQAAVARKDIAPMDLVFLCTASSFCSALLGRHEKCLEMAKLGLDVARSRGVGSRMNQLLMINVAGLLGMGNHQSSALALLELEPGVQGGRRIERCLFECLKAWIAMLGQQPVAAREALNIAVTLAGELRIPQLETVCRMGLALALLDCGDASGSNIRLLEACSISEKIDHPYTTFMCLLLSAQLSLRKNQPESGLDSIRAALRLAQQHSLSYCIWWDPAAMAEVLVFALVNRIEEQYARHLIRLRRLVPRSPPLHVETWPWPFRTRTLGGFCLFRDDEPVSPSKKSDQRPIELLKVLIALGGRGVESADLETALWPRVDSEYSHKSFTITLHRLRRLVGDDDAVLLRDGKVTLNPRLFWLDTWALDDLIECLPSELRGAGIDRAQAIVERLFSLYTGPFLHDGVQHQAFNHPRERMRAQVTVALGILAELYAESGRPEDAVTFYERALKSDRTCENFYRALMQWFHARAERQHAIDAYRRCRSALAEQLETEPSPETESLYREVIAAG